MQGRLCVGGGSLVMPLISARKAGLIQERAGDLLPNHYGKLDIWRLSLWIRQERGKKRSWSCELG